MLLVDHESEMAANTLVRNEAPQVRGRDLDAPPVVRAHEHLRGSTAIVPLELGRRDVHAEVDFLGHHGIPA